MQEFWNITASGREAEIDIFGEIGDFGSYDESRAASDFIRDLRALGKVSRLNINIHSPGGSVWDGLAMYAAIRNFPAEKVARVSAIAASAASFIMLAADRIEVAPEAEVMIHDPIMMAVVYSEATASAVHSRWSQAKNQILNIYERRTGQDRDHLSDLMAAETWFIGDEIKEAGFADAVMKDTAKVRVAAGPVPDSIAAHWKNRPRQERSKPAPLSPEIAARYEKVRLFNG